MIANPDTGPSRPPFRRSATDRYLFGVCGGLARTLGVDPTLVRLGAILLAGLGGAGVLAYAAAVLLVPEEGHDEPLARDLSDDRAAAVVSLALLLVGALLVFGGGRPWPHRHDSGWWVLPVLGAAVLYALRRHRERSGAGPTGEEPRGVGGTAAVHAPPAAGAAEGAEAATVPLGAGGSGDVPPSEHATLVAEPASRPRRGRDATLVAGGVVLLAIAVTGALAAAGAFDLSWDAGLAAAVIVAGVALAGSAFWGGARGLIVAAIPLVLVAGAVAAADLELRGGIGHRTHAPLAQEELQRTYGLAIGQLDLDLRHLRLTAGGAHVRVRVGIGEVNVVVPPGVAVDVRGHASGGDVAVLGRSANGTDVDVTGGQAAPRGAPRLTIEAAVGFGDVWVRRAGDQRRAWHAPTGRPAPALASGWGQLGRAIDAAW